MKHVNIKIGTGIVQLYCKDKWMKDESHEGITLWLLKSVQKPWSIFKIGGNVSLGKTKIEQLQNLHQHVGL